MESLRVALVGMGHTEESALRLIMQMPQPAAQAQLSPHPLAQSGIGGFGGGFQMAAGGMAPQLTVSQNQSSTKKAQKMSSQTSSSGSEAGSPRPRKAKAQPEPGMTRSALVRMADRECYVCGEVGHMAASCPDKGTKMECWNCHQFGHSRDDCTNAWAPDPRKTGFGGPKGKKKDKKFEDKSGLALVEPESTKPPKQQTAGGRGEPKPVTSEALLRKFVEPCDVCGVQHKRQTGTCMAAGDDEITVPSFMHDFVKHVSDMKYGNRPFVGTCSFDLDGVLYPSSFIEEVDMMGADGVLRKRTCLRAMEPCALKVLINAVNASKRMDRASERYQDEDVPSPSTKGLMQHVCIVSNRLAIEAKGDERFLFIDPTKLQDGNPLSGYFAISTKLDDDDPDGIAPDDNLSNVTEYCYASSDEYNVLPEGVGGEGKLQSEEGTLIGDSKFKRGFKICEAFRIYLSMEMRGDIRMHPDHDFLRDIDVAPHLSEELKERAEEEGFRCGMMKDPEDDEDSEYEVPEVRVGPRMTSTSYKRYTGLTILPQGCFVAHDDVWKGTTVSAYKVKVSTLCRDAAPKAVGNSTFNWDYYKTGQISEDVSLHCPSICNTAFDDNPLGVQDVCFHVKGESEEGYDATYFESKCIAIDSARAGYINNFERRTNDDFHTLLHAIAKLQLYTGSTGVEGPPADEDVPKGYVNVARTVLRGSGSDCFPLPMSEWEGNKKYVRRLSTTEISYIKAGMVAECSIMANAEADGLVVGSAVSASYAYRTKSFVNPHISGWGSDTHLMFRTSVLATGNTLPRSTAYAEEVLHRIKKAGLSMPTSEEGDAES